MNCLRTLASVGLAAAMLSSVTASGQQKKTIVGILPTYDMSGQSYGPSVSQIITVMLFEQYANSSRFQPVYLNPGGNYDPTSTDAVAEYVQTLNTPVDLILSTMFTEPEDPKKGDLILHLKATRIDSKSSGLAMEWKASKPLKERNAFLAYASANNAHVNSNTLLYQPREFRKQPLGKAAADLASQIVQSTSADVAKLPASGEAPPAAAAKTCTLQIKINFQEKHAISKSYTVFIQDRDETLGIKEGLLDVTANAGRLPIMISLHDKPYKLPVQTTYLFSPTLDCSRTTNLLDINIGPAGEAHTVWR